MRRQLGSQVTLTRTRDRTVTLAERNRIANKRRADLFISIHANASKSPKPNGVQTYYLNNASDQAAQRLASRENAAVGNKSELDHIVSIMLQNAFTDESRRLATTVQRHLVSTLNRSYSNISDKKVRSALFYVLVGAKSPSILVETSFISNPVEENRLRTTRYQELIAQGITNGVNEFLRKRKLHPQSL